MGTHLSIIILSDSVGETAELVIKAGLSQFSNGDYSIQRISYVDNQATIDEAFQLVEGKRALIAFTIVDPELRNYVLLKATEQELEAIDIMGPMMDSME